MAIVTRVRWLGRDERGSIMVSGLMLVFVMTLLGSGVFYAGVLDNRAALDNSKQTQASYIAEAGLNAGLRELMDGDGTNDFAALSTTTNTPLFTNRPLGAGSFTVTAIPMSNPSGFMVRSTACVPGVTSGNCPADHTAVTVQRSITSQQQSGPIRGTYFLLNTFSLTGNGAVIDGYDSSQATCQTEPANCYTNTRCQKTSAPFDCGVEVHVNGTGISSPTTTPTLTIGSSTTLYGNITDWRGQVSLGNVYGNVKYRSDIGSCPTAPNCTPHVLGGGTVTPVITGGPEVMPQVNSCYALAGNHYTRCATITNNKITVTGATSWSYNDSTGVFSVPAASSGFVCRGTGGSGNPKIVTFAPMTVAEDPYDADPGYCFSSLTVSGGAQLNPRALSGGGNVIMYVTGPPTTSGSPVVSITGNADINANTSDAKRFQLRVSYDTRPQTPANPNCPSPVNGQSCLGVTISGNATWYLWVYAPYTQISAGGNGTNMYGALVGYDFVAPQGSLHFDKALYNAGGGSGGGTISFQWGTWQACNPSCP